MRIVISRLCRTAVALAAILAAVATSAPPAQAAAFDRARIGTVDGRPSLLVDGKPFFFFGGAFFYPRIPPERWRASMLEMRALGANTIDLYVPWNWHEVADGSFDFDGRTNPRRDLRRVLRLANALGFRLIVRPGPMIRNEWRNGGYPAWLLKRPEYGMPLHDVLEGRYAATATLQNAHSDDAAAEWLHNPTHLRYASRWLNAVLHELRPYANRVIAIQLDDDQAAYSDNQTWPAPHLQRYLRWLDERVRAAVGRTVPTFINTYDMKVPASAPVWAMGNWYGTAQTLGEHDRIELDYATATLTTQPRAPLAYSEFQAGWLAAPEDPQPRASDPANTALALAELLAWGTHGVVAFPLQDTLAPFGWEAPFSNALYAWDAAIARDPGLGPVPPRREPYAAFGAFVRNWGRLLAATHRSAEIAIAYGTSALDERTLDGGGIDAVDARFKDALRACAQRGLTCDAVDLRFATDAQLRRYRTLVVPPLPRAPIAAVARRLAALRAGGANIVDDVPDEAGNGIVALAGRDASFGIVANWGDAPLRTGGPVRVDGRTIEVPAFTVAPRSTRYVVLDLRLAAVAPNGGDRRVTSTCPLVPAPDDVIADATDACAVVVRNGPRIASFELANESVRLAALVHGPAPVPQPAPAPAPSSRPTAALAAAVRVRLDGLLPVRPGSAVAYRSESFGRGDPTLVLQNSLLRAIFVPRGGARLVVLQRLDATDGPLEATNATGALRDDALVQFPASRTDRIARYTHSYPAGTFNRAYKAEILASGLRAVVRFSYDAPDVLPRGARFVKTVSLEPGAPRIVVDEAVTFAPGTGADRQRAVSYAALAVPPPAVPQPVERAGAAPPDAAPADGATLELDAPDGVAAWTASAVVTVLWIAGAVEHARWTPYRTNGTLTLVAAAGKLRTTYGIAPARTPGEALTFAQAERDWLGENARKSAQE